MLQDLAYLVAAVIVILLVWTAIDEIAYILNERRIQREREAAITRMMAQWSKEDREFALQQRRIRGEAE